MQRPTSSIVAAVIGLSLACASVPTPRDEMARAELSIQQAEQAGAAEYAAVEMRMARDKMEDARRLLDQDENARASRAAEQAEVDAQLAATKARKAKAASTAKEMKKTVDALQQETIYETR